MAADAESTIRIGIDTTEALASIKKLQAQISAFHTQLQSSGNAANAAISDNLQRGLIKNLNATGQFAASLTTVKSSAESFTTALEKNKLSMGEYFRYAGGASKTFGRLFRNEFDLIEKVARERVKTVNTQFIKMGRDANGAITAIKVRPLVADLESLAGKQAIAAQRQQVLNQLLKQGSTNLLNFGKNTQWAGRQLMVGFTIPLAYLGTVAGKTFMKMEEQALRFKRVYGELTTTSDETDRMVKDIQRLANEYTKYGVAVEKTMELAADAAAMGKMGSDLTAQVAQATRLAVLGNVEQAQALETTIAMTNAFGTASEDLAKKIDFLNAVENQTVTSIEDLTIAIPKAGPVIQQLGGDVEDLAFFLTAMKEGGINASEGANALKSGLASLINPTEKAAKFMEGFGINLKGIVESNKGDVKGIVLDFAKALDTLDPLSKARSIEQLFGKFQFARLSTLFQNVIAEGNQASRVLKLTRNATEELAILSERELKRVEESTGYKFKKALEDLKASLIPLGEQFLKIITPIAEFATKVLSEFNKLSDGTKSVITTIVTVLGGIGPVALMTFGLLANGVANIIKLFTTVRTIFSRFAGAASGAGASVSYMTQEQLEASAVAASLNQTHAQLIQTFTLEKASIDNLTRAYERAIIAQGKFNTGAAIPRAAGKTPTPKKYNSGVLSVPGPKGAGDIIPAMLAPGEAVIPADAATKYRGFIADMIAGKIPGFFKGFLGMPRSGKSTGKNREAAKEIYENFKQSSLRNVEPENYGHQITPTSGHSFPIFGLGGVYSKADGSRVFVKPVLDERAAIAEIRATEIARKVHGLEAPEQRIVVMRDPADVTRQRRFIALESKFNPNLINDNPVGQFNQEQYFKQLVASLLRTDKDLSASNLFGNVLADVGPAGVFSRASGVRDFATDLPSMEQQAMINLLAVKGGAKKAFAESTVGLMANLTPKQYHDNMIAEIKRVLPKLRKTVDSYEFSSPEEALAYTNMVKRLEDGLKTDWSKFHAIHSAVVPTARKSNEIRGYNDGVVSVPGPKGAGDVVPAMLAPGEAVIPAKAASKYRGFISAMIAGKIPGFLKGIENVGKADRDFISGFAQKYSNIPELEPIIQKTIDRMNAEGIKITQGSFRSELKKDSGRLFELANTTARVSPTTGDSSAMTGLNATHGNAPITITPDMAKKLAAQVGEDSGFGRRLIESAATGKNSTAMSNLVFGMPSAFNRQEALMSGTDSASFVKKFPKLFMEPIVKMYARTITGLDGDKLGVNQFAEIVSKKLAAVGKKAVTEKMFYDIVQESMAEMKKLSPSSPALKALEKARNEFRVIQYGGGGGRRGELTKGLAFNAKGQIVPASGAPNYRGDASRAAIAGGTSVADDFAEKILQRALKSGTYLPNLEEVTRAARAAKAPAVAKTGGQARARKVPAKKFPGGFDINRVSSTIDSRGTFRYFYLDENGKKVPLAKVDYTKALGLDPKRLREIEQNELLSRAQAATVPEVAPRRGGALGKAAGISALAIGGVGLASNMMPQGGQQQEGGGIDLMSAAIIGSTVASIPMMFGQTIPQFLKSIGSFASKLPGWAKVVGLLATAIAPFIPQIAKSFTPLRDTEEYTNAFNEGLVNNRAQLDAIATTFGKVASADIYERVRQNKFLPLEYAPGQTPFGDTFAASDQGKAFIEEYKKALSDSGPQAAVQKLSQELSYQVISGIFTVDQAKSIAMTIGQQLEDMSIGINVSAKLTDLLGPDGKKLEGQTGDVLSSLITTSGQPLQTILNNEENFAGAQALNAITNTSSVIGVAERFLGNIPLIGPVLDSLSAVGPIADGLSQILNIGLDASKVGTFVSATMSTVEAGRQSLATFELIYDEKEATVQKEIDHARAIKDTAAEAKALEKLETLQKKRAEERIILQEAFTKQLQAAEDIYTKTSAKGRSDILSGFMDQFTNLYKDTPTAPIAEAIKADLERLKDNPFVVNIAAALATGAIKPESFNALLTGLDGKPLESNILTNVSSVIKTQGTQAGGELITLLNKLGGRSDLQLTLSMLVQQDSANLDALALLGTLPGGGEILEFYLDPKVNPNNLEDLNTLKGNLSEIDNLIQSGDFNMEKLLELDLNLDETQMNVLKENAEWFDKLPDKQKKVFTSVFMSILPTITNEQIDAAMAGEVDTAVGDETNPLAADRIAENTRQKLNTPQERARIAAKLAADQAKAMIDYLDLTDGSNNPQTPTDGGKGQVTFLDSLIRKVRDLYKSTQKLTTGWQASSKAILELGKNLGEAFAGRGLAERLREAGVTESLIPGLLDLKANNPEEFAKLFKGGKVSGGLNELGQTTNNLQIATAATESFAEAQSRSARVSIQNQTALTRLLGLGVSYSDALVMLQDENFAAMVATGRFNDEVKRQIGLFNDAKAAAAATAQGMTDEFKEAYDLAMERFAAEEAKIDIQLEIDTAADQDLIAKVQEQIALINDQNDDLDYGLTIIADQEEDINKEYDDRLEALDEVEKANKRIASLQSKQISLAQAIAEGDVFAAAKAMQELEAANAEAFAVDSRDMLERERTAKLEQATAEVMVDGVKKKLTRLEIEELIKNNIKAIAKLEEEQLEPAEARVRKATALAEETKRGLTIAGDTKAEWEKVGNQIDLARLDVIAYDGQLGTALTSVEKIVQAWKDVKLAQDAASGGTGDEDSKPPANDDDSKPKPKPPATDTTTDSVTTVPTSTTTGNNTIKEVNPEWTSQNKAVEKAEKDLRDLRAESAEVSNTIASLEKQIKDLAGVPGMSTVLASLKKELAGKKTHLGYLGSSIVSATTTVSKEKAALAKIEKYKTTTVSGGGGGGPALLALATGGFVSGPGTPTSDSIPAMLSNGEYVINAKRTKEIGTDILDAINFGNAPGFAAGGGVNIRDLMIAAKKNDNKSVQTALAQKEYLIAVAEKAKLAAQKRDKNKKDEPKPKPGDPGFYRPRTNEEAIGLGMSMVVDNIYRGLFGQAALNTKYGIKNTGGDYLDSAVAIALNALPVPAAKGVTSTAKFGKAFRNSLDKNYVLTRTEMRDTLPAIPGMPPMKVAPYPFSARVEANSPSLFYQRMMDTKSKNFSDLPNLPLRGFEDYSPGVQNFMGKMLGSNVPYRIKRKVENGISDLVNKVASPGIRSIPETLRLRHRSTVPSLANSVTHPLDVPVSSGRAFGPGTYFGKDPKTSRTMFRGFGDEVYRPKITIKGMIEQAKGKGYLKLGEDDLPHLGNMEWDDPFIQDSIKKGYIGIKHKDAYTNWLIGTSPDFSLKKVPQFFQRNPYAMGGLVKPAYFNYGGMVKAYAKGGDVVPSMLTPGEFVMSKYAVQNYGVDKMKALNSGTYNGDSVYNYNLSVNVTSDANPDDIARTVMTQIRQIESQRIRSAR